MALRASLFQVRPCWEHNLPRPLSSRVPAWFEWKFDFTFPAEQYPNVCVRLWGTPARLEEIIRKVTTDVLVGKPQEKRSAQEHAGHLLDLEPLWMTSLLTETHSPSQTWVIARPMKPTMMPKNWRRFWLDSAQHGFA